MYIFQSLKMIVFIALLITGAFTAAGAGGAEAVSDQEREETVPTAFQQLIQSRNLLGNYGGSRSAMEDQGIFLSAYYNYFFGYKANGGQEPGQTKRHSGSLDTYLLADFEEMQLIPGGELLLHMKLNHGRNVNPHVGALSDPFDDADFSKGVYIGQFWYQQGFLDQKCRFRFGYLSMGTILDRNAYANSEDKQFFSTYLDNNNATILLKDSIGAALFLNPA
ncbi:MAG: hypothetical protein NUV76_09490, partial [Candidatus Kuenenia sp.]|nr:hypothetical protein [Candidatus Kuenenia sp.]